VEAAARILDLEPPIAVVCHDAGAANIILSWLEKHPAETLAVMRGPAERLWRQRFPTAPLCDSLGSAVARAQSLLSGTGWASDLEHMARLLAAQAGLRSVAVIDHWVNYPERFERSGRQVLPDEIWVTDNEAERIASAIFSVPVQVKPNTYLLEQVARAGAPPDVGDILFVAEPIRDDWGRGVPGEFQALDFFLSNRSALGVDDDVPIRLRPHPSEVGDKYLDWIARQGHRNISLDVQPNLADAMRDATWVVGCQSFALIVAIEAHRRAVSVLPPWAPRCALPHRGLLHLRKLAPPSYGTLRTQG
jgi:hypothetical protein